MREDAFVIGGGPAGLVAAIALRRKGLRVTIADGGDAPSDKACGEGILPEGIAALERIGIELDWSAGRPFRGIRFVKQSVSASARFGAKSGLGMRRIELHRQLIRAAELAGVSLLWRTSVVRMDANSVVAGHRRYTADWIVGADGFQSQVRQWANLAPRKAPRLRYAFRQHFACAPWTDCVEVHWAKSAQLYVTPVSPSEVGVVALSRNPKLRLAQALPLFPEVCARLAGCKSSTAERGAVTASFALPRVTRNCVALIGDASGTVDAITGEGMSLAFLQAEALAGAIGQHDLAKYEAAHSRLRRRPIWMARALLAMEDRSWAQERVLQIFASEPELFERVLAAHTGESSSLDFASAGARLGWRLLAAN